MGKGVHVPYLRQDRITTGKYGRVSAQLGIDQYGYFSFIGGEVEGLKTVINRKS